MLLNEIFDTKADVIWAQSPNKWLGTFNVDKNQYQIDLNIDTIQLPSGPKKSLDTAFRKNESGNLTGDNIPFKVIGPVLWAMNQKVKEIKPDLITFFALTKDGNVEGRMSLYDKLGHLMSKTTNYEAPVQWIDIKAGKMTYMQSKTFTRQDNIDMKNYINSVVNNAPPK